MTLEERVYQLENRLDNLQASFIQAQKNVIPVTEKADSTVSLSQEMQENTQSIASNTNDIEENQDALCEFSETAETNLTELEQAICDLSEEINNNNGGI